MAVCVLMQRSGSCFSDPPKLSGLPVGQGWLSSMTHLSLCESMALQSKEPALVTWGASTILWAHIKAGKEATFQASGEREGSWWETVWPLFILDISIVRGRALSMNQITQLQSLIKDVAKRKRKWVGVTVLCWADDFRIDLHQEYNDLKWPGVDSPLSLMCNDEVTWGQSKRRQRKWKNMKQEADMGWTWLMGLIFIFLEEHNGNFDKCKWIFFFASSHL